MSPLSFKQNNTTLACIIFAVFVCTHFLMLFIDGEWWDDYVAWNVPFENLYKEYGPGNCNDIFNLYFLQFIYRHFDQNNHIFIFRICSFVALWVSVLCSWFVINNLTNNKYFTFFVCMLFSTFGFDRTAFLTVCIHYAVANMLFMAGLVLFTKDYKNEKKVLLIGCAILWLLSLIVWRSSALLIPLTIIIASCSKSKLRLKNFSSYIECFKFAINRYWTIFSSLIIFLFIYVFFLNPSGVHANYYKPDVINLLASPILAIISGFTTFISYLAFCLKSLVIEYHLPMALISILAIAVSYLIIKPINYSSVLNLPRKKMIYIAFLFMIASFILPLSIYGVFTLATPIEYRSRTLSLSGLPLAVICVSLIYNFPPKYFKLLYALLLSGSILYTFSGYINYGFSLSKTDAIVQLFQDHKELENQNIIFIDNSFETNGHGHNLRSYEYEGMARIAYGSNTKTSVMSFLGNNQHTFNPTYKITVQQTRYPVDFLHKTKFVLSKYLFHKENIAKEVVDGLYIFEISATEPSKH